MTDYNRQYDEKKFFIPDILLGRFDKLVEIALKSPISSTLFDAEDEIFERFSRYIVG